MPSANVCTKKLVVRRRADLIVSEQWQRAERVYVVKDPLALKYYRFSEREHAILQLLDRPITPGEIAQRLACRFPAAPLAEGEVTAFIASLAAHSLVVSNASDQGRRLVERRRTQRWQKGRRLLTNILTIRTPGIDPTKLLNLLYPWTGWFFSRGAMLGVALLAIIALAVLAINAGRLPGELLTMHAYFGPGNWLLLALTFVVTKMLHELGHALACRRCGGECHEIGVMFLVLTPCLYCDVSDSWMLPSKWQRAAIAAAGMYVEVTLASLATIIWSHCGPGALHFLALQVMLVCGVSTVLFNGNPLARYDGYYILADLAEIPNLREQARAALAARLWSLIGVVRRGAPRNPSCKLTLFGLGVTLYRWLLLTSILWVLHHILKARGLEVAWQFMFLSVALAIVVLPALRLVRAFRRNEVIESMHRRQSLIAAGLLLAAAVVFFFVPLPRRVHCTFETRYADAVLLYAPHAATLTRMHIKTGDRVQRGQQVAELRSADLGLEISQLQAEVTASARALATLRYERFENPQAIDAVPQAEETLAAARQKLKERTVDLAQLQVIAPRDGYVLLPPRRPKTKDEVVLASWTGTPLDARNTGTPLVAGDVVCEIGDPARLEAQLVVNQADVKLLRIGQHVDLVLDAEPLHIYRGRISDIAIDKLAATPAGMSIQAGGQVPSRIDSAGVDRPASPSYTVIVPLAAAELPPAAGLRGSARIGTGRETLASRSWRYVCRTFRFSW